MTIPQIGATQPPKERVTNDQVFRAIGFVTVVLPTAVAVNVLLWTIAAALWGGAR